MLENPVLDDAMARTALREALAVLEAASAQPGAFDMSQALTDVARRYQAAGSHRSAEACLQCALRWARAAGSNDLVVDLLCELCETAARVAEQLEAQLRGGGSAARERARSHGFDAATLAGRVADRHWEAKTLLRIGDVLERCGDRARATLLETRALRIINGHVSAGGPDPHLMPGLGRLADG